MGARQVGPAEEGEEGNALCPRWAAARPSPCPGVLLLGSSVLGGSGVRCHGGAITVRGGSSVGSASSQPSPYLGLYRELLQHLHVEPEVTHG